MSFSSRYLAVSLLGVALAGGVSCSGSDATKPGVAATCTLSSECSGSLVCSLGRCHSECGGAKDCSAGARCVKVGAASVCQLDDEKDCIRTSACRAPLVCATDSQCRSACSDARDCFPGQVCAQGGVCADQAEVDGDNRLPSVDGGAGTGGASGSGGRASIDAGAGGAPGNGGAPATDASPGGGGASTEAGVLDAGPKCDPSARPDENLGVFAVPAPAGNDANNGTRLSPVASLGAAVTIAKASGRRFVYLAPGEYQGTTAVSDVGPGLVVEGGFVRDGTKWTTDCAGTSREETVLIAQNSGAVNTPTLSFAGALGNSVLRRLSVKTKLFAAAAASGADGESLVALFVGKTATGSLSLDDVWVRANGGGNGASPVAPAAETPACGGLECGEGATGTPGAAGVAQDRGSFSSDGYVPARGTASLPGTYGENGTTGGGGALTCHTCGVIGNACTDLATNTDSRAMGRCGCGGPGAGAVPPGGGGGASVGVYVASKAATVRLTSSKVEAARGGDGATGLGATTGVVGANGLPGTKVTDCIDSCTPAANPCTAGNKGSHDAGGPGGPGGRGGDGAKSGDGSGGPSYGIVVLGPAGSVLTEDTPVAGAQGGTGASGTAASAARFDAPACGNGVLDAGEACDDANRVDDDACGNDCQIRCSGTDELLDPTTGRCFAITTMRRTFAASRAECRHRGTGWDLATFGTVETLTRIVGRLGVGNGGSAFIGATKNAANGLDSVNGLPLPSPPPWNAGEPNGALTEPCVQTFADGKLNDISCTASEKLAICEKTPPNFQGTNCGDGTKSGREECDDGNPTSTDFCSGCLVHCPFGAPDVENQICYGVSKGGSFKTTRADCQTHAGFDLIVPASLAQMTRVAEFIDFGGGFRFIGSTSDPTLVAGASKTTWKWVDGTDVDEAVWKVSSQTGCGVFYGTNPSGNSCTVPLGGGGVCSRKIPAP